MVLSFEIIKIRKEKEVNPKTEEYTIFDIIKKGQELFLQERFFESYSIIRESVNKSEISNDNIWSLLKGDISLIWESSEIFHVIDKPNYHQSSLVSSLKDEYSNLLFIDGKYFDVCKSIDYSFFEMISPKKFQKDILYNVKQLNNFMMDIVGQYFIIKEEQLLFVEEKDIERNNPFL